MEDKPQMENVSCLNDTNSYIVGIPLSPTTLYVDKPDNRSAAPPGDLTLRNKRTSFQITSVTVQGSRTNNDDMDDSADDYDESHTDDISSDILDSSKVTEPDGYYSEDAANNTNCDDLSPCGPLIITALPSPSNESDMNVGLGIDMSPPYGPNMMTSGVTMMTNSLDSPVSAQVPIINPLPDNWQHRFKVVKIVSSEPFKRGRWLCMDFKDPPSTQETGVKKVVTTELPVIQVTPPPNHDHRNAETTDQYRQQQRVPVTNNTVAHVFEIPISSAYTNNVQQLHNQPNPPFYGIFLPQFGNNNQCIAFDPLTIVQNFPTDVNFNLVDNANGQFYRFENAPQQTEFRNVAAITNQVYNACSEQPSIENNNNSNCNNNNGNYNVNNTLKSFQNGHYVAPPSHNRSEYNIPASQKRDQNFTKDDVESAASTGASTVAIDNKIEQAMDLVKSHLMFAVREEVEVLKEKITELLERISQLEHENDILRANASPETLKQLNQSQKKFSGKQAPHLQTQPPS